MPAVVAGSACSLCVGLAGLGSFALHRYDIMALSPRVRKHLETFLPSPRPAPLPLDPPPASWSTPERHATIANRDFAVQFAGTSPQKHSDARGAPATDREIREMYRSPRAGAGSSGLSPARVAGDAAGAANDAGETWSQRLRLAEQALASPRSYPAYILHSTQQMSFKPIAQGEGTAARWLGVDGLNFHRKRDHLTDYTEELARIRGSQPRSKPAEGAQT